MTTLAITVTEEPSGRVHLSYKARATSLTTQTEADVCRALTEMFKAEMLRRTGRRPDEKKEAK